MRLVDEGVPISSGVYARRMAAAGLWAATVLNRDHRSAMARRWSATAVPSRARRAISNNG